MHQQTASITEFTTVPNEKVLVSVCERPDVTQTPNFVRRQMSRLQVCGSV